MTEATLTSATIRVEDIAASPHYRRLAEVPGIVVDLRYAGRSNFAGRVLYRGLDCAWLRREAAQGLAEAAHWLERQRSGWRLLVLDALRPQRVQEAIWADVEGSGLEDYFAHPGLGSIHSYGMAVDVTLVDAQGAEADMGSGFDEMHERSHPAMHAAHLASGALGAHHVSQRDCLRDAMAAGGFSGISTEWWHFNHGSPDAVRRTLPRVL